MKLSVVPTDTQQTLIPLIEKIGRAVKFEYLDKDGVLNESEGIIERVTEYGVFIALYNPLSHKTIDGGLQKYFPFRGTESLVRIVDKNIKTKQWFTQFVNPVENFWFRVDSILEAK